MQIHTKRILLIEEDYVYFLFFKEVLNPKYEVTRVVSIDDIENYVKSEYKFDLIIYNAITSCNDKSVDIQHILQILNKHKSLVIVDVHCYESVKHIFRNQILLAHSIADIVSINDMIDDLITEPIPIIIN